MSFSIDGMPAFTRNCEFVKTMVQTGAREIVLGTMLTVADRIRDRAEELAPVDTGKLEREIVVEEGQDECWIHSKAPYSLFQEFGTVNHSAQPFMRPAFHEFRYFLTVARALQDAFQGNIRT